MSRYVVGLIDQPCYFLTKVLIQSHEYCIQENLTCIIYTCNKLQNTNLKLLSIGISVLLAGILLKLGGYGFLRFSLKNYSKNKCVDYKVAKLM